jgi:hypothetical protein
MTKEETLRVLAILKAAYPASYNGMTKREAEGTVAVWNMQFASIPGEIVLMAVHKLISTNRFPPTISEVKEKLTSLHWEARDMIYSSVADLLSEKDKELYRRIYEVTKDFRVGGMAEPSLPQMLNSGQMLRLGSEQG